MGSRHQSDIHKVDKAAFEQLLQERLQNPTPSVLCRRNAGGRNELGRADAPSTDLPERNESRTYSLRRQAAIQRPASIVGRTPSSRSGYLAEHSRDSSELPKQSYAAAAGDKRSYVLYELLDTEQVYVKDLEILVAVFAVSLCKHAGSWSVQAEQMLRPLQVLFSFQYRFLQALRCHTSVAATAQLFSAEAGHFAVYIDYCGAYHWLCDLLERLKADSEWPSFMNEFRQRITLYSDDRRLGLRDFLIKPVQRICKYPLFLKELLKQTDKDADSGTFNELSQALALLKGICEGVDQVQQRIDSLRLRQTLLSSYCDSPELPLSVIAKLGDIVLSGPLHVTGCVEKGLEPPRLLGCVLFKRFLLILKPKRSGTLVPQFWFPLHTMQAVDEGLAHSWQLQHIKSGQFMVFQATSSHEKHMWMSALNGAIAASVAYVRRRESKCADTSESPVTRPQQAAGASNDPPSMSSKPTTPEGSPVLDAAAIAAVAAAAAATSPPPSKSASSRSFWSGAKPFGLSRSRSVERHFKEFTSPEILRLRTVEALKHDSSAKTFPLPAARVPSPPRFPFLAASRPADTSPENSACINSRPSDDSYPSRATAIDADHHTEADADSEEYGAFSISSTCHEPARQQTVKHTCTEYQDEMERRRSLGDINDNVFAAESVPTEYAKDSFSGRLLDALGHFSTLKRASTNVRHGRSFSVSTGDRKY
ncbi:hypothetical protein IWW55_001958 [Coemansia sp. RSA 2706]|nr:hypothetical protein IWW55_001958 [Coemansia sp. RSA 2706]